jgi:dihydrofolate reductase
MPPNRLVSTYTSHQAGKEAFATEKWSRLIYRHIETFSVRYLQSELLRLLEEEGKMAFIAGPRQVGKTTLTLAQKGIRIYEIPISYRGRTYEDGKKISAKDGFRALWCLAKYGILRK